MKGSEVRESVRLSARGMTTGPRRPEKMLRMVTASHDDGATETIAMTRI